RTERALEGAPVRALARHLGPAPDLARLRIRKEVLVGHEVLAQEARERLAARENGPEQQALGLAAVGPQRVRRIAELGEPGHDRLEIGFGLDLTGAGPARPVRAVAPAEGR